MTLRSKHFRVAALALAAISVAALAAAPALASNMGFKMNRQISALGANPIGQNNVALPYRGPYNNAQDICVALNLTAATGRVSQINAATGVPLNHTCGNAGAFALLPRVGMRVTNPTATNGIIVGSHVPGQSVSLSALGAFPRGQNSYPVVYHTTAVNAQDLCVQAGLTPASGRVSRINAATGVPQNHTCGNAGAFGLVLGEAVTITNPTAVNFVPAHF